MDIMRIRQRAFLLTAAGAAAAAMISCSPQYAPNSVNTPMLSERGEVHASLELGSSGFQLQSAYALGDRTALMLNAQTAPGDNPRQSFVEGGVGYFSPSGDGRFETFGGFGVGRAGTASEQKDIWRAFGQIGYGFPGDNLEVAFALRLLALNFNEPAAEYESPYGIEYEPATDYLNVYLDPVVTARAGWRNVKFHAQIGASIRAGDGGYTYIPVILNLGMTLRFNALLL
ncbi:MAG: hypothetical protein GF419_13795 [Ignavibacteriales bacterium]|nr:hypothetical protein [Ignavibacteriales bacterium]